MKKLITAVLAGVALSLPVAAPAAADTDSIVSWGNDTLGGSQGTTGASGSLLGYTATVDGFGTFTGSTTLSGPSGPISGITQEYSLEGLHTSGFIGNQSGSGELELYDGVPVGEITWDGRTVVCDPICHVE